MAITFKTDQSYGLSLAQLFGISKSMITAFADCGGKMEQVAPGTFLLSGNGHSYSVKVSGQVISLAKSGELGPASKSAICGQFEAAMSKIISSNTNPLGVGLKSIPLPPKESKVDEGPASLMAPLKPKKKVIPDKVDELATGDYVSGTSKGSQYKIIATFDGMALAVKTNSGTTSLRAFGGKLVKYAAHLSKVGFTGKENYSSVHFSIKNSDQELRNKTIGAVLATIGIDLVADVLKSSEWSTS